MAHMAYRCRMPNTPNANRRLWIAGLLAGFWLATGDLRAADEIYLGAYFPYREFGALPATRLEVGGGVLTVAFAPGELRLPAGAVLDWVGRGARAVALYFGRLPDPNAKLLIVPASGNSIRGGTTWGFRGAASRILLGRDTTEERLQQDWVLVHELVHHAMPALEDRHHWMEEGLATYVEPVARAQSGELRVESVWADLVKNLHEGLPKAGDQGLDHTPTWGRTYWGGALYFLLAEIEIRRRTNNQRGLQDALRALVAAGSNIGQEWPIDKVLAVADVGTGTTVLREIYGRMKDVPVTVNLGELWKSLGVSMAGGEVRFDDAAPQAAIRQAITRPRQ